MAKAPEAKAPLVPALLVEVGGLPRPPFPATIPLAVPPPGRRPGSFKRETGRCSPASLRSATCYGSADVSPRISMLGGAATAPHRDSPRFAGRGVSGQGPMIALASPGFARRARAREGLGTLPVPPPGRMPGSFRRETGSPCYGSADVSPRISMLGGAATAPHRDSPRFATASRCEVVSSQGSHDRVGGAGLCPAEPERGRVWEPSQGSHTYGPLRAYSLSFAARMKPASAPSLPPPVATYFCR